MNIKEILQKIDINAEEQEISDFLKHSGTAIGVFFKEKWNMFKQEQLFALNVKGIQIQLPNGKKDKEYSVPFNLDNIGLPDVECFEFANLPEGISYSEDQKLITGTPTLAGDYKIVLRCISDKGYKAEKEILFIVISDPKDLWKNIPSEQDETKIDYPKPDSDKRFLKVETKNDLARKDMVAASQRGRSHAIESKPRDDDFALDFDDQTEWYIMVVADGAGSAKFSRKGSQIACQTAIEVCKKQLADIGDLLEEQIKLYWDKKTEERKDAYEYLHQIVGKAAFEA
ncbi:MAG: protein phosphatase 2C domain-containing protein, partial [Tannerella sp.]|nr:protein phosphatase 2C domain-containing protein [Tannerella sp.]